MRALAVLLLTAGSAAAETAGPAMDYFTGIYERVGRSAGPQPGLIDDLVRIEPAAEGQGLSLSVCAPDGAPGSGALTLHFDPFGEVTNLLQAGEGRAALYCQFFNDAGNYPIIACAGAAEGGEADRARFTLWPVTDARSAECAR